MFRDTRPCYDDHVSERIDIDVTLIDAMLALTPEERLRQNDRTLAMIQELRDGIAQADRSGRDAGRKQR
ncbi:MAG: hypothetical protein JWO36_2167 [Myxococcales bacterium]|nr:hypothetical protein [Myxococcales bacterium]